MADKKVAKAVITITLSLFVSCWKFMLYVLAWGNDCSGTGTGATRRFYRICNYSSFFIPLGLDLLFLSLLTFWRPIQRLRLRYKVLLYALYAIYVIVSPLLWNLPFFLTPVYPD